MRPFTALRLNGPRLLAVALGPVLQVQGQRALARVPRLAEAVGPDRGVFGIDTSLGINGTGGTGGDTVTAVAEHPDGAAECVDAAGTEGAADADDAADVQDPAGTRREIGLLVVGESTAVGVGVETHDEGIAAVLARDLHTRTGVPVRWRVIGRNGARLRPDLRWANRRALPPIEGTHDLIVVMLGVNDTLGLTSAGRWRRDMSALLETAREHLRPGGHLLLAGVPRLSRFPALPQPLRGVMGLHALALDRVLAQIAENSPDVRHVPTPAMTDRRDLATDHFHPSAHGYGRWAAHLAQFGSDLVPTT